MTVQVGCFVQCETLTDENRNQFASQSIAFPQGVRDEIKNAILLSKWIMTSSIYFACTSMAMGKNSGKPFARGIKALVFVSEHGRALKLYFMGCGMQSDHSSMGNLHVLGLGISFMHCKNVRQIESKETASEKFHKQYGVPKYTYRTIQIDPMKEVLRREGKSETDGMQRAMHICRGHFSTYSEDKPLFGKYPGTFYVPDHVRGNKKRGEVVKDYDVKPGDTQ